MANASFGVNIIPKNNTVTIGNSDSPWTIVSPDLTGTPTAPTAASGTNTTQIATTAFVKSAVDNVDLSIYALKNDTVLTGTINHGRKQNTTVGTGSIVLGYNCEASGAYSNCEGFYSKSSGDYSHGEGYICYATGHRSHAEGSQTTARGNSSHAEGSQTTASGASSHAEGGAVTISQVTYNTEASGSDAHAEGTGSVASGKSSHAEGSYVRNGNSVVRTTASKDAAHAEGLGTTASEWGAHSEGYLTTASGAYSHAEGANTTASGEQSHSEGVYTGAFAEAAHAEGSNAMAYADESHAEGFVTKAHAFASHVEGNGAETFGIASHVEGIATIGYGQAIHVSGKYNVADAVTPAAWVSGQSYSVGDQVLYNNIIWICTEANSETEFSDDYWSQNNTLSTYAEIVGGGLGNSNRKNIRVLDWIGNQRLLGTLYINANNDGSGGTEVLPKGATWGALAGVSGY